jgi:MFS superfamily sulfate permease-like transporter
MATTVSPPPNGTHSGQWGLAALFIGGLIIILFPIVVMSMFGAMVGAANNWYLETRHMDLGVLATEAMVGSVMLLALFAALCGVAGLVAAVRRGQPVGLALAGIVLSVPAVVLSVVLIAIASHCIDWARTFQKDRFDPPAGMRDRVDPFRIPR